MLFVFFVLAGFSMQACVCEKDPSYYIIEMPEASEEDAPMKTQRQRSFKVYWNVPTMQCKSKKIPFDNLSRFGIIQNKDDRFRQGDKMTILYDPGFFPALFNSSPGTFRYRNGGVPQQGNIDKHLDAFNSSVEEGIPDQDYDGIAVIDFESWKPIFTQNYGILKPYINVSYEIERKQHWWWPNDWIKNTAQERYERAAKIFMESTLKLAKKMRPKATWGYYAYPYCYNKGVAECSDKTKKENDRVDWLWKESTGIFPSIYTSVSYSALQLRGTARGAAAEAARVARGAPVLPYISYVYRDQRAAYYTESDLEVLLDTIYNSNADGVVVWGASSDVNTKQKCEQLLDYITNTFGPMIEQFTKGNRRRGTETTTNTPFLENATLSNEYFVTTENKTVDNDIIALIEEQTETTLKPNEILQNVSDFSDTVNTTNQESDKKDINLNSVDQLFDSADPNSSLSASTEHPDGELNPDDTPGFTQNDIDQPFNYDTDKNNSNVSMKIKKFDLPISTFDNFSINWRKLIANTPTIGTTANNEIITETSTEFHTKSTYFSTYNTDIYTSEEVTTESTTTTQELPEIPVKAYIYNDSDKDSNEILESLTKLTGYLDKRNSSEPSLNNKTIEDEEFANASKILQDLTEEENDESYDHTYKTTEDSYQSNHFKNFYDFATIEDNLYLTKDIKTSDKYEEVFEEDMIFEAVADILNTTERTELTTS